MAFFRRFSTFLFVFFAVSFFNSAVAMDKYIENFRRGLLEYFRLNYGRVIDFNKRNEANALYDAIKRFENEISDVPVENLGKAMADYIKNVNRSDFCAEVLDRAHFEENLKNNSNFLRLFCHDFLYDKEMVKKYKDGLSLTDFKKIRSCDFETFYKDCLYATNCKEVSDNSHEHAGPWLLWVCNEFAVDLNKVKVVDLNHLVELIYIIQYDYPEEFGFVRQIENNFNEKFEIDRLSKFDNFSYEKKLKMFLESYFGTVELLFNSRNVHYDKFYQKKIGESYFDVILNKVDKQKHCEINRKIEPFKKELEKYDKQIGVFCEEGEDFKPNTNIFYVNKRYAILNNKNFLAKLLGYDVLFRKYNVNEGELGLLNIAPNDRNGDYYLLNYGCISQTCSDEKTLERVK